MGWKNKSKGNSLKRGLLIGGFIAATLTSIWNLPTIQLESDKKLTKQKSLVSSTVIDTVNHEAVLAAEQIYSYDFGKLKLSCMDARNIFPFHTCMHKYLTIAQKYMDSLEGAGAKKLSQDFVNTIGETFKVILDYSSGVMAGKSRLVEILDKIPNSGTVDSTLKVDYPGGGKAFIDAIKILQLEIASFEQRAKVEKQVLTDSKGESTSRDVLSLDNQMKREFDRLLPLILSELLMLITGGLAAIEYKRGLFERVGKIKKSRRVERSNDSVQKRVRDWTFVKKWARRVRDIKIRKIILKLRIPKLAHTKQNDSFVQQMIEDANKFHSDYQEFHGRFISGDTTSDLWELRIRLKAEASRMKEEWDSSVKEIFPEGNQKQEISMMINEAIEIVASL
jgi:hypothetical protein